MKKVLDKINNLFCTLDGQIKDISKLSPDEIRYQSLLMKLDGYPISKNLASIIVGGNTRLSRLIEDGDVRYIVEPDIFDASNKKHLINFADCIKNTKPEVLKIRKMTLE